MSFPAPTARKRPLRFEPELAFSADGSKFAMAVSHGGPGVSVWNIQSKTPLKRFAEVPKYGNGTRAIGNLQFSSGKSGKEALVFVEVCPMFTFWYPRLSNRWSEFLGLYSSPWNHSCDWCDIAWDGRNYLLKVSRVQKSWVVHRSGCTFLRSKWGNSVCWILRNTLRVGHAEKWAWARMVDWGGVGCLAWQI